MKKYLTEEESFVMNTVSEYFSETLYYDTDKKLYYINSKEK